MTDPNIASLVQRVQALETPKKGSSAKASASSSTGSYTRITPQSIASGSAAVAFTSVAIGNYAPATAKAVYGSCRLKTPALLADTTFTIDCRANSSDTTRNLLTVYGIVGVAPDAGGGSATFLIPLSDGTFQYQVTTTGANPASFDLKIEAYLS